MNPQEAIRALSALGISQSAIARDIGVSQPTINRAAKGGDIRFSTGQAILDMHARSLALSDAKLPATLNQMMPQIPTNDQSGKPSVHPSSSRRSAP
ncbi:helix-turn-helix domain-containing protein [Pseudomonas antarctica]|uniref:helix-turn-helix domain-containing protein n=1 Tax=Pseudomonas antarctica TaxID=219572 RepID=UPI0009ED06B9|nr:helix-turn-helix domain-containing protein [Pseudomonas antarctica]